MDDHHKPHGHSILEVKVHPLDADGFFVKGEYVAGSDARYSHWVRHEMGANMHHHFCRTTKVEACMKKVGSKGVIHVMRWVPVTAGKQRSS